VLLLDVFSSEFAVAKNLSKEASPDGFTSVDRDNSAATIGMLKKPVAALLADNREPEATQSLDEADSGYGRKCAHTATATR
jgi:hypothetical protein